ncbi:carbohydrate binding domain-containing protein [Armatimonas sp.]|uniref:carbohydrate binding domain-containing protein n=1 Tax=Armatimonas sp. TaxID=1872638 RepID=UPI00374CF0F4
MQTKSFPFSLPWDDARPTATSVAALNPAPLTSQHKLVAKNGHFHDATGRRVRFVGMSIGAAAAFPSKADAPKIAARLHKYGVNLVRLHHLDAQWATPNLFNSKGRYTKTTALDPQSLDLLEFFIAQLKKNGIYVDLNLHVSREWLPGDGFPAGKLPELGKVVAYFHPKALALQKQFATQILTHKNPYTGLPLAADPVLALVELNNEDSLVGSSGQAEALPTAIRKPLEDGWRAYLARKYGVTAALKKAWSGGSSLGQELLKRDAGAWITEMQEQTKLLVTSVSAAGQTNAPSGPVLQLIPQKIDTTNWHLQLHQTGLTLETGKTYTVSFVAKASAPRMLYVNTRLHQAPWSMVGLDTSVGLDTQWKRYTFTFVANGSVVPGHCRLSLMLGDSTEAVFLGEWSLRPGSGGTVLASGQSIERDNIALGQVSGSPAGVDYTHYLMTVEDTYCRMLKAAIAQTGCTAPVACSQASYGGIAGTYRESKLDWVDMHAYWQHPSFPGTAFDPNNYRIENTSMLSVSSGAGVLDGLAMHRVAGKPFTVSEYDHPAPSEYSTEMTPLIFAYAAWQDWDGVFLFAYETDRSDKITGFFDQQLHPAKLGFLPAAAALFLRGDLAPASLAITLTVPISKVPGLKGLGTDYAFWSLAQTRFVQGSLKNVPEKADAAAFLTHRASIRFESDPGPLALGVQNLLPAPLSVPGFVWDHKEQQVRVHAPASKALIGKLGGKATRVPGFTAEVAPSVRNFAVITLTAQDGKPTEESRALLLTALDKAENPGLTWNAERTFAADAWRSGPTQLEVPTATLQIATKQQNLTVWALDGTGERVNQVPATLENGTLTLAIGPEYQTLWYEIVAK